MQIDSPQPWQQEFEHLKINDQEPTGSGGCDSDDSTYDSDDSMGSDCDEAEAAIRWWEAFNRKRSEKSKQVAQDFLQQVEKNQIAQFPWPPDPNDCGPYEYIRKYLKDFKYQEDRLELAKKFLDQVESSWGYDVDCCPPHWVPTTHFRPMDVDKIMLESPQCIMSKVLNSTANSVIIEINTVAEAKKMSKRFELVRIIKAVFIGGIKAAFLLTLTIKDVELDIDKTVRAMVSRPPVEEPKLVECKLISSGPA